MPRSAAGALAGRLKEALAAGWGAVRRPEQAPPAMTAAWRVWLILSGRGWGKTRTGAETVQDWVMRGLVRRVALVGATAADVRDVMVEGESGLLRIAPDHFRPVYEPSKRRLTWPNGAVATLFSADEPERLRGPQHDCAWCDELGAWRFMAAWDMLNMGLRVKRADGGQPLCIVTTTPKPIKIIRELLSRVGKDVIVTRGRTLDNASNLAEGFLQHITNQYAGTRLGRQELDGELLEDVPGALWQRKWIDDDRVARAPEGLRRICVAIDPAVSNSENADETGIIVAGTDGYGQYYVLEDATARLGPLEWAKKAISLYRRYEADRIVAETNNGGALVEATLRQVDREAGKIPYKEVKASRGKAMRAEPISALYEQHKVHHVGEDFDRLEDQMCAFTSDFDRARAGYSPDRVDALVWALTELSGGTTRFVVTDDLLNQFSKQQPYYGPMTDGLLDPFRGH